jgi:uncharacterized protein (TIGR02145 family)
MTKSSNRDRMVRNGFLLLGILIIFAISHSCEEQGDEPKNNFEMDSITDIDGNVYKTIKVGTKWWMAENLKVSRYRNGDSVVFIGARKGFGNTFDAFRWASIIDTGAYCVLLGNDTLEPNYRGKKYGYLYNGYTILDPRNIAPEGWHVPSDEEWKELELYLGMDPVQTDKISWRGSDQGNKLKLQSGWYVPANKFEVWGSNESGFSALGGACKMPDGSDSYPGVTYSGFWWTNSETAGKIWYRYLDYNKPEVFRLNGSKTYGFSIRCVRD